ncbi:MAG: hypothetical protein ACI4PE_01320 [Bacilli bacterium]
MDKEIVFRVVRIFLVIMFVLFVSSVRNITKESYEDANKIINSLNASLQVVKLSDGKIIGMPLSDEDAIKNDGYKIKITNWGYKDKKFTIALINDLEDNSKSISYTDIRYQVKKDNVVVATDNLDSSGYLYNDALASSHYSNYEIKFWIDEDVKTDLNGKMFSSKIAII